LKYHFKITNTTTLAAPNNAAGRGWHLSDLANSILYLKLSFG